MACPQCVIEPAKNEDYDEIYRMSVELLMTHIIKCESALITQEAFNNLLKEGAVQLYILRTSDAISASGSREVCTKDQKSKSIGFVAVITDYDVNFGGIGIVIDQFYVDADYRRKGYGKMLLNKVYEFAKAQNARYVRLLYQKGMNRGAIYSRMGFKDYTQEAPFLRVYALRSAESIKMQLGFNVHDSSVKADDMVDLNEMKISSFVEEGFSYISWRSPLLNADDEPTKRMPSPQFVIVTKYSTKESDISEDSIRKIFEKTLNETWRTRNAKDAEKMWKEVTEDFKGLRFLPKLQLCGFVEQATICCWMGHILTFSNYFGDLSAISKALIVFRVRRWNPTWGPLNGVAFEVHGDERGRPTAENNHLCRLLQSLNFFTDEDWRCVVLETKDLLAKFENLQ